MIRYRYSSVMLYTVAHYNYITIITTILFVMEQEVAKLATRSTGNKKDYSTPMEEPATAQEAQPSSTETQDHSWKTNESKEKVKKTQESLKSTYSAASAFASRLEALVGFVSRLKEAFYH